MSLEKNAKSFDPKLFHKIAEFWSFQLNNEIYLRGRADVVRGSKEYFDIILDARKKFIYYFPKMVSYLKASPSRDLLEVGCGMGADGLLLSKEGFNVIGLDLAPGHLKLAQRLFDIYEEKATFFQGNAEDLPFPENSLGCAYTFGVLHHTPNTARAIEEIHRVLVPQGRAVIMLYHKWSLNNFAHFVFGERF